MPGFMTVKKKVKKQKFPKSHVVKGMSHEKHSALLLSHYWFPLWSSVNDHIFVTDIRKCMSLMAYCPIFWYKNYMLQAHFGVSLKKT